MTPEQIARVAYEADRAYRHILGAEDVRGPWEDAPRSARAATESHVQEILAGRPVTYSDPDLVRAGLFTAVTLELAKPWQVRRQDERAPAIGSAVHYMSYGTPGGEYGQECRAAIVTKVVPDDPSGPLGIWLAVLNPTGIFLDGGITLDTGRVQITSGGEQRTHLCLGRTYDGGTWHWPAEVTR